MLRSRPLSGSVLTPVALTCIATIATTINSAKAAVDTTWTGLAGSGVWATGGNWTGVPNQPPSADGTGLFIDGGNGFTTLTVDSGRSVAAMNFTTNAVSYTIGDAGANGGNTLTLANAGNTQLNAALVGSNITATIDAPLSLGGTTATITNSSANSTNKFNIRGNLTTANAAATTLNLNGAAGSTGANVFSGAITKDAGTTSLGVSVGGGNWTLSSADSTFNQMSTTVTVDTVVYNRGMNIGAATVGIGADSTFSGGVVTKGPLGIGAVNISNANANLQSIGGDHTVHNTILMSNVSWAVSGSNSLTLAGNLIYGGGSTITNNITTAGKTLKLNGELHIRDGNTGTRTIIFAGNGTTVINGAISNGALGGAGSVTIGAAGQTGITKMTAANTYTGTTSVTAGSTLLANGTHQPATVGGYTINGTLGGTGSITPSGANGVAANTGAAIAPGDSTLAIASQTGTLDIGNKITFNAGSSFNVQLGGATPGDGAGFYDQLNMTLAGGSVTVVTTGLGVTLNTSLVNGYTPTAGSTFYVLTRADGGTTSAFFGLPQLTQFPLGTLTAEISYTANWTGTQGTSTFAGAGNDVAIRIVPEPATLGIAGIALGVWMRRRRRQERSSRYVWPCSQA